MLIMLHTPEGVRGCYCSAARAVGCVLGHAQLHACRGPEQRAGCAGRRGGAQEGVQVPPPALAVVQERYRQDDQQLRGNVQKQGQPHLPSSLQHHSSTLSQCKKSCREKSQQSPTGAHPAHYLHADLQVSWVLATGKSNSSNCFSWDPCMCVALCGIHPSTCVGRHLPSDVHARISRLNARGSQVGGHTPVGQPPQAPYRQFCHDCHTHDNFSGLRCIRSLRILSNQCIRTLSILSSHAVAGTPVATECKPHTATRPRLPTQ